MTTTTPQILELDPPIELTFQGPFSKVVETKLTLCNPSNNRVGFKMKGTVPKQYNVTPHTGVIVPHGEQEISVMLLPMDEVAVKGSIKHNFLVQSLCVDDDFAAEGLDTVMKNVDKRKLMKSELKCLFIDAEVPSSKQTDDHYVVKKNVTYQLPTTTQLSVSLPFIDESILLSVGDRILIPVEVWKYTTGIVDKWEGAPWLSSNLREVDITGTVRWLGTLPPVGDSQYFAGIETDIPVATDNEYPSGCYGDLSCFTCPKGHGVFLPVECVVRYSKSLKETPTPAYLMNARPHGIALIVAKENHPDGRPVKGGQANSSMLTSIFQYLQYSVQHHTNVTSIQMIQLMEKIASMDHTTYDSFVCYISYDGRNDHYIQCNNRCHVNIYELVDKVQQCPTLQRKPKLFFIDISRHQSKHVPPSTPYRIGSDTFILWSTQKGKRCGTSNIGSFLTLALEDVFKLKSKSTDLLSMATIEVPTVFSMIPPFIEENKVFGKCSQVESQLKYKVFFFNEDGVPGMASNDPIVEEVLNKEDNEDYNSQENTLNQTHYSDIMEDIKEIAVDYKRLAAALKLPIATVRAIEYHRRNCHPWDALSDVITEWLKWNCDCKTSEGYPNRLWLVNAVKSINNELGIRLAKKYNV